MDQSRQNRKCEECQEPIPTERLKALPETEVCVVCQSARERLAARARNAIHGYSTPVRPKVFNAPAIGGDLKTHEAG